MKNMLWIIALAVLGVAAAGCTTVADGKSGYSEVPKEERSEQLERGRKLGDGILTAFQKRDFKMFRKNTPGELGENTEPKDFLTSCGNFQEKFGTLTSFHYLTNLDTPAFSNQLWVATFERKGTNDRVVKQQLLFRLVSMYVDGRSEVVSYGFI